MEINHTYDYFMGHVRPYKNDTTHHFYTVTKPLHVFKKIRVHTKDLSEVDLSQGSLCGLHYNAIANLIIPVNAIIHCQPIGFELAMSRINYRKMRASKAKVHSIALIKTKQLVSIGRSSMSYKFIYMPGKIVSPERTFSMIPYTCESGIHFFLSLPDALRYVL